MERVKTGDEVVVIAGKFKGQKGKVLRVIPDKDRVVVQGVHIVTKHLKRNQQNPNGGIVRREGSIHGSNVMLVDPKSGQPTRVRYRMLESGRKVRIAVKSGEQIDR